MLSVIMHVLPSDGQETTTLSRWGWSAIATFAANSIGIGRKSAADGNDGPGVIPVVLSPPLQPVSMDAGMEMTRNAERSVRKRNMGHLLGRTFPRRPDGAGPLQTPLHARRVPTYSPSMGSKSMPLSAVVFSRQPDITGCMQRRLQEGVIAGVKEGVNHYLTSYNARRMVRVSAVGE